VCCVLRIVESTWSDDTPASIRDVRIPQISVRVSMRILTKYLRPRSQQEKNIVFAVYPRLHWFLSSYAIRPIADYSLPFPVSKVDFAEFHMRSVPLITP